MSAAPPTFASENGGPQRRQHVARPPMLLTASLNHAQNQQFGRGLQLGQTPLSATSLSSPFSLHHTSPYPTSLEGGAGVTSGVGFSARYNPQQWGRIGDERSSSATATSNSVPVHGSRPSGSVAYAPRIRGADDPMASPPPPYSPEAPDPSPAGTMSPSNDFSPNTVPSSASTPDGNVLRFARHAPNVSSNQVRSPLAAEPVFPPPPPVPRNRHRSMSRNHAESLLTAMNLKTRKEPPVNAIGALQQHTANALIEASRAPASRRAASAGALSQPYHTRSPHGENVLRSQEGSVLPPPPPGPPPSGTRAQSLSRPSSNFSRLDSDSLSIPRIRQTPVWQAGLGPIPPTPANWRDEDSIVERRHEARSNQSFETLPLRLETNQISHVQESNSSFTDQVSRNAGASSHHRQGSVGSIVRSPAVRTRSAKGLLDRRSESRSGRAQTNVNANADAAVESSNRPLKDLILPSSGGSALARRRLSTRLTPRNTNGFEGLDAALGTSTSLPTSGSDLLGSAQSTPHFNSLEYARSPKPFSSREEHRLNSSSSVKARTMSPLTIQNFQVSTESTHSIDPDKVRNDVSDRVIGRHRAFLEQEAMAKDSDKMLLFVQYILAEARIRHYDLSELVGLIKQQSSPTKLDTTDPWKTSSGPGSGRSRSASSTSFADTPEHSRRASTTATSEPILVLDTAIVEAIRRKESPFIPVLSPIASMSAVTGRDEIESRGRTPSRWWESQSSNSGEGFRVLERTKRESKYMSTAIENEQSVRAEAYGAEASSSQPLPRYDLGPAEYPLEKMGYAKQASIPPPPPHPSTPKSAPFTPDPRKLDTSRLTTLPPPYPRHYPAVNNSHPELAEVRGIIRSINDQHEPDAAKERYEVRLREKRKRADSWSIHQKSLHDHEMRFRVEQGEISHRQYDEATNDLIVKLNQSTKELTQETFDLYQEMIVTPLHALFSDRINCATAAYDELAARFVSDSQLNSPSLPETEGDEQPELLERLTMLKWLHEARESLHRESFLILSTRNDLYKDLVVLPYQQARNTGKIADAQAFFESDSVKRKLAYDSAAYARWQEFYGIVNTHVNRGIENLVSSFWDISPQLQTLLQKVPSSDKLATFEILIPRSEVDENPSYWMHPLRYLYGVLAHAEASTRQFIESQVNLWCLLQEVREGLVGAKWRVEKTKVASEGREWGWRAEEERETELSVGVQELKERVEVVESQWAEGLGAEIERVRIVLREHLEDTGGWDEELEG